MSGIIDTVGSKSGIVGSDVYPAGHVINTFEYYDSGSYSISVGSVEFQHVLGTATGTSALSSASNKLLVVCSVDVGFASQTSAQHWRIRFDCTGFTNEYINANFGYQITTYQQERMSFNALITPGTTTPTISINCIEAGGGATLMLERGHFNYQEIQV